MALTSDGLLYVSSFNNDEVVARSSQGSAAVTGLQQTSLESGQLLSREQAVEVFARIGSLIALELPLQRRAPFPRVEDLTFTIRGQPLVDRADSLESVDAGPVVARRFTPQAQ